GAPSGSVQAASENRVKPFAGLGVRVRLTSAIAGLGVEVASTLVRVTAAEQSPATAVRAGVENTSRVPRPGATTNTFELPCLLSAVAAVSRSAGLTARTSTRPDQTPRANGPTWRGTTVVVRSLRSAMPAKVSTVPPTWSI